MNIKKKNKTMSNNKQSSVEWYANEENKLFTSYQKGLISTAKYILFKYKLREQAKAMHKQENLQTWLHCLTENDPITFEDYYNETFNNEQTN